MKYLLFIFICLTFISCKKEIPTDNDNRFLVMYDNLNNISLKLYIKIDKFANELKKYIVESKNSKIQIFASKIELLQKESYKAYDYISSLEDTLKYLGDYDKTTEKFSKINEIETNYKFWMSSEGKDIDNGGRGAGAAFKLRNRLDSYVDWASKFLIEFDCKDIITSICCDLIKTKTKVGGTVLTWEYGTFHNSTIMENMATLRKLQIDVLNVYRSCLEQISLKLLFQK